MYGTVRIFIFMLVNESFTLFNTQEVFIIVLYNTFATYTRGTVTMMSMTMTWFLFKRFKQYKEISYLLLA